MSAFRQRFTFCEIFTTNLEILLGQIRCSMGLALFGTRVANCPCVQQREGDHVQRLTNDSLTADIYPVVRGS